VATVQEAFAQIESSEDLRKKFSENPQGTLQGLGVDTSSVNIRKIDAKNTADIRPDAACVSIGEIVCFSVG
jgi:hypothetical protein